MKYKELYKKVFYVYSFFFYLLYFIYFIKKCIILYLFYIFLIYFLLMGQKENLIRNSKEKCNIL